MYFSECSEQDVRLFLLSKEIEKKLIKQFHFCLFVCFSDYSQCRLGNFSFLIATFTTLVGVNAISVTNDSCFIPYRCP